MGTKFTKLTHAVLSLTAILFGLLTIIAGTRVLTGNNPGYIVFQPLLVYNVLMGIVYVITGIIAWRNPGKGKHLAAIILILNVFVLGAIGYLYTTGSAVASESLAAMVFRSLLWLVLFSGLAWVSRQANRFTGTAA